MPAMYIVLYGSLMSGFTTQKELGIQDKLKLLGVCEINGKLYDLGDYPGLVDSQEEQDRVEAELFEIKDKSVLKTLDKFEGYWPSNTQNSLYLRKKTSWFNSEIKAWVYYYNRKVKETDFVGCRNWETYLFKKSI